MKFWGKYEPVGALVLSVSNFGLKVEIGCKTGLFSFTKYVRVFRGSIVTRLPEIEVFL